VTKAELEAVQIAIDRVGEGLDMLMDLVCEIEAKAKRKPPKKKTGKK
jgi:hypothetical protein